MDPETEVARAKWLLIGVFLFLASGCMSYGELVYAIGGHDAVADVTKTGESRGRRGNTRQTVDYTFTEPAGTRRKGTDTISTDWQVPPDGKVAVRYTSGEDGTSRLSGNVNRVALGVLAFSLVWIGVFAYRLFREANDDPKPRPRRRRPA